MGWHVKLNPQEFKRDTLLRDTILPLLSAWRLCGLLSLLPDGQLHDRPPLLRIYLYVDNAIHSISLEQYESTTDQFFDHAIRNINLHHPAVVVIGTGKINSTEVSRFSNWASQDLFLY